ncbi:FAD-dependent oxidoreductase [soil metagenome]
MNKADVVVLGAGPAGISAALALGPDTIVLERRHHVGGLANTFEMEGAVFDVGGHSFHTPHPEVRQLVFDSLDMYEQRREARCYAFGSMISYPFQKHFRELPNAMVVEECAHGLRDADDSEGAANFEEFLLKRVGSGIAEHFLLPYNRKLWGGDLKRLSADWVSQRVASPEGINQEFALSGGERKPLQSDSLVGYPARGGYGEILRALARKVKKLRFGIKVVRVDAERKKIATEDGEVFHWHRLISTVPVNELLKTMDRVPNSLLRDAQRLEYLSLKLALVVIGHPVDTEIQRIYAAEPRLPAHKIVINHNSSPYLRSLPHHGITGEVSYSAEKELAPDIEERFLKSLVELKIIKDVKEALKTVCVDVRYAYPVPTPDRDNIIARLKHWLCEREIYTVGRFGEWTYINSDEAIYRGLNLGRSLNGSRWSAHA